MSLHANILWDEQNGNFFGCPNYGDSNYVDKSNTLANEALVFMLVALNGKWKWPIAYFFKKSLSGATLAELILTALSLTSDSKLKVRSITCDGASVNISALNNSSVAAAIEFLKQTCLEFQDSETTIKFIRVIDSLFDFMNSRNPFGKGSHEPITRNNINTLEPMMIEHINYLFSLKTVNDDMLCTSNRRTFICGMAVTVKSILSVAKEIFSERVLFKYILTYKFSQDFLEIFFSIIRNRHGFNNNPNVLQFQYAMRQILLKNDIKSSTNSNCLHLDSDPIGSVFQFIWKKKKQENDAIFNSIDDESDDETEIINDRSISNYGILKENILFYIGGYIIKKILSQIDCDTCASNLQKEKSNHYVNSSISSKFLDFINNGGLIIPNDSVFKILKETERQINIQTNNFTNFTNTNLKLKVLTKVKNSLALNDKIFPNLDCENVEILETPHKIKLIIFIATRYIKIRLHFYSKFYFNEILKLIRKRHRLTKQILFSCE
ncbi:THAP domain-containing protein 9 [Cyphomyrmex costatus]|uniref:THAP domain-containing protein 9 n=1 Tax=Cyphomyrmex costatus TaxID=456900 RepID=A0A151I7P6_9HYME|nr:THAP domain-containing protein 9 [Cyphomyrmex costatus]